MNAECPAKRELFPRADKVMGIIIEGGVGAAQHTLCVIRIMHTCKGGLGTVL